MAVIIGTSGNDTIRPSGVSAGVTGGVPGPEGNTIHGLDGNDYLQGHAGSDSISGGAGNDTLNGNPVLGIDTIDGGDGVDWWLASNLPAAPQVPLVFTQLSGTSFALSSGTSAINVEIFDIEMLSDSVVNLGLTRNGSMLRVTGGGPGITLNLDWSALTAAAFTADATVRTDSAILFGAYAGGSIGWQAALSLTGYFTSQIILARLNLTTGSGDDTLVGTAGADTLIAGDGNDILAGGLGGDILQGGGDADTLRGGAGNDTMFGGTGLDTAEFDAPWSAFTITRNELGHLFLTRAGETDQVRGDVELLRFTNATLDLRAPPTGIGPDALLTAMAPIVTVIGETAPDEDADPGTIEVEENSPLGTVIGFVAATDANLPAGDAITFTLVDEAGAPDVTSPFALVQIDAQTAELRVAGPIDFETQPVFGLRVRVTDLAGNSATQPATVVLLNLLDTPPTIESTGFTLAENQAAIGALAGDGAGGTIAWSFEAGGADNALFTLDATTGALAFANPAGGDFESDASFELSVRASTDGGFATRSIAITLTDGPDTIAGSAASDLLGGTAGVERIIGNAGDDTLLASTGADTLDGGAGTDAVRFTTATLLDRNTNANSSAEALGDRFIGIEAFEGSAFADTLRGDGANDRLRGAAGDDQLLGAAGNDQLDGGSGRDTVLGGAGDDLLSGAGGSDSLADGAGADTLVGGLGADRLSLTADGARDVVRITHLADAGDKVLGFVLGEDAIELSRAGLGVAADATLDALFTLGSAAPAGSEYALLYNAATGQLRADTNGDEAGGVIILATLIERPLLTMADLTLIA